MSKLNIVIPAFNEQNILQNNVLKVLDFCEKKLDLDWEIIIVDNKSSDETAKIGKKLSTDYNKVKYLYIDEIGKGVAIKSGWESSLADFYLFMDADLATDLSAINLVILEFKKGSDIVMGSRFHKDSKVKRNFLRRIFSFGYYLVLHFILKTKITDAPCGFKAINNQAREKILPLVKNYQWFFDSELVLIGEHKGLVISEIPVIWQEPRAKDNKSKVKVFKLSFDYLQEVLKLKRRFKSE